MPKEYLFSVHNYWHSVQYWVRKDSYCYPVSLPSPHPCPFPIYSSLSIPNYTFQPYFTIERQAKGPGKLSQHGGGTWGTLQCSLSARPRDTGAGFLKEKERGRECAPTCIVLKPHHSLSFQKFPLILQFFAIGMQPDHSQHCGPSWGGFQHLRRQWRPWCPGWSKKSLKTTQRKLHLFPITYPQTAATWSSLVPF